MSMKDVTNTVGKVFAGNPLVLAMLLMSGGIGFLLWTSMQSQQQTEQQQLLIMERTATALTSLTEKMIVLQQSQTEFTRVVRELQLDVRTLQRSNAK